MINEVIVIGGGIIGSSITYHLAQEGIKVTLIEKGSIGNTGAASKASAGGLRENDRDSRELSLAQASLKRWSELEHELNADIEYSPVGQLKLFKEAHSKNQVKEIIDDNKNNGIESYLLDKNSIANEHPSISSDFPYGIFYPNGGHANSLLATTAFANAAKSLGAIIKTGEQVLNISYQNGEVIGVKTQNDLIPCDAVVNAAGIWSEVLHNSLQTEYKLPIKPRIPQMSATFPAPQLINTVISVEGTKLSLKQTKDGKLRAGGGYDSGPGHNKFTGTYSEKSLTEQRKAVLSVLPEAQSYAVDFTYNGAEAESIDGVPIIGGVPDLKNYFLATGFSGHGFTLAPAIGQYIAELIQDKENTLTINGLNIERFRDGAKFYENRGRGHPG
ncbi:NAD(P)/FAD-dependent oxidoreductase [Salinicoccus albus]|uniref:NAD(P)/FAD-dependent oxidoreductase n=1 Tax=Salinicoccus albus TaxID=418756 RepID=UPI000377DFA7|nr:FAD-binding oxidoreductase [Salinicoccus albus]